MPTNMRFPDVLVMGGAGRSASVVKLPPPPLSYGSTANPCTSTSASASQSRLTPIPAIAG